MMMGWSTWFATFESTTRDHSWCMLSRNWDRLLTVAVTEVPTSVACSFFRRCFATSWAQEENSISLVWRHLFISLKERVLVQPSLWIGEGHPHWKSFLHIYFSAISICSHIIRFFLIGKKAIPRLTEHILLLIKLAKVKWNMLHLMLVQKRWESLPQAQDAISQGNAAGKVQAVLCNIPGSLKFFLDSCYFCQPILIEIVGDAGYHSVSHRPLGHSLQHLMQFLGQKCRSDTMQLLLKRCKRVNCSSLALCTAPIWSSLYQDTQGATQWDTASLCHFWLGYVDEMPILYTSMTKTWSL